MGPSARHRRAIARKAKREVADYCSKQKWMERFPITSWLPKYRPRKGVNDLIAGLTVGLTVLPQGLAYASIAKLPSVYGLYAAIMGGFFYAVFGMSKDISVGPTAIMSLLVAQYGTPIPGEDELNDPTYAILLAFFCGIIQFMMGVLHLGFIANYISAVVISGFTSASAITIAMSQVKTLLGIKYPSETFLHDLIELFNHITETRWQDVTLGISCIIVLAVMRFMKNKSQGKLNDMGRTTPMKKRLPWKLVWLFGTARNAVIVVVAAAITYGLHENDKDEVFSIVGNVTAGLPEFAVPNFGAGNIITHLNFGLIVIPILGFLENIAIAKGFARQNNYRVDTNQELIALGTCNIATSFVSGYPVTGSFSRSAINNQSAVETQAAGMVTGILVLLSLAFLTPIFFYIPKASLAAIIMFAVIFMIDYHIVVQLWRVRRTDLITLAMTFFFSLWLGVEYGTIIGILVDLLMLLYPYGRPGFKTRGCSDSVIIVQLEQGLRFPSVGTLQNLLDDNALLSDTPQSVVLDFTNVFTLDFSVVEGLKDIITSFKKKRLCLYLAGVRPRIRKIIDNAKIIEPADIYDTVDDALGKMDEALEEVVGQEQDQSAIQLANLLPDPSNDPRNGPGNVPGEEDDIRVDVEKEDEDIISNHEEEEL